MTFPNADGDEGEGALARQEGVVRWRQNHGKKRELEPKPWEKEGLGAKTMGKRGNWNPVQSFLHSCGTQRLRETIPSKPHPRESWIMGKRETSDFQDGSRRGVWS